MAGTCSKRSLCRGHGDDAASGSSESVDYRVAHDVCLAMNRRPVCRLEDGGQEKASDRPPAIGVHGGGKLWYHMCVAHNDSSHPDGRLTVGVARTGSAERAGGIAAYGSTPPSRSRR